MEQPTKPLCMKYDEAKREIFAVITDNINKHALPLFLAEIIVKEAFEQVKNGAKAERKLAQEIYEQQINSKETEGSGNE